MATYETDGKDGVKFRITDIDDDSLQQIDIVNWPSQIRGYSNSEMKRITKAYSPQIVRNRIGVAFPEEQRDLEEVVHPIIAIASVFDGFVGIDARSLEVKMGVIDWCNHHLTNTGSAFRARYDPTTLDQAVDASYLIKQALAENIIYFPTEKAVRTMCNLRGEDMIYAFALHTGVDMGGMGHKKLPPWAGD